jgi:hypothetical protein
MSENGFQRYLLAKQSVDDRALNKDVVEALRGKLPGGGARVIEIGAGIGTMLLRMIRWGLLQEGEALLVDADAESIAYGLAHFPEWAAELGLEVEEAGDGEIRLQGREVDVRVRFLAADVYDLMKAPPEPADMLVAHAFLDLMPLPESLPGIMGLTKDLAWLTLNFDGVSVLEPVLDPGLDALIEQLYHESMDLRETGGDSRTGRRLFGHLSAFGAEVLMAGASDWVVYPSGGRYPADEAYFLKFILNFYESSLKGHPDLDESRFVHWLATRRAQAAAGELVYLAHQLDFLVRV